MNDIAVKQFHEVMKVKDESSLHPHMFRHGLAIYLLQHGVSDKIIARRLGHSSAVTTIKYYMVITPEIERDALKGILL